MKTRNLLLSGSILFSVSVSAQVGINNTAPKASLDITAKNATGISSGVEGLLIPRIDRQKAQSMIGVPTSTMIYLNSIATGTAIGATVNMIETGYYYFDGTVWLRFNDVGVAPLTKVAFNGSGTAETAVIGANTYKKLSFPTVNIMVDPQIGIWNSTANELTVNKKGVYTITTSLIYENAVTTGAASLIIRGGAQNESSSSVGISGPTLGPFTQRNNMTANFVLNSGDKIWIEGVRGNSSWTVGRRSLNITFSEIN